MKASSTALSSIAHEVVKAAHQPSCEPAAWNPDTEFPESAIMIYCAAGQMHFFA